MADFIEIQDAWDDAAEAVNAVFVAYNKIEEAKQSAREKEIIALNTAFSMLMAQAAAKFEQCDIRIGNAIVGTAYQEAAEEEIKAGGTD